MTLVLASNNKGKLREFQEILAPLDITVIPQKDVGASFEVNETGASFAENAYLKAAAVKPFTPYPVAADDSGLCVDALDGAPGLYSARFGGGKDWTDKQKYEYLLELMKTEENRAARFAAAICCILPDGRVIRAEGVCPGYILRSPEGVGGFGYDPVFRPEGFEHSFAAMGEEEKNQISHRAKALQKLREELKKLC